MNKSKQKNISISLGTDNLFWLQKQAEHLNISCSAVVRVLIGMARGGELNLAFKDIELGGIQVAPKQEEIFGEATQLSLETSG